MKKKLIVWLPYVVSVVLFGALGYYFYVDLKVTSPEDEITVNAPATTTPKIDLGEVVASGDYKIEVIKEPQVPEIKRPQLERPITFSASFSSNAKILMVEKIEASISLLKKDPGNIDEWLNLAIYRKMLSDYKGAEEIWIYLTKILKEPSYVYANLADLYGYFLKDPVKAEGYFKDAIRLETTNIEYYTQFAYFYLDVMKDSSKAVAVAEAGYALNKTRPDFKNLLEQIHARITQNNS